jgi:hypothetical protein
VSNLFSEKGELLYEELMNRNNIGKIIAPDHPMPE